MKTIQPTTGILRMLASIKGQQWMIRPDLIQGFALSALEVPERSEDYYEDFYNLRQPMSIDASGIASIHVTGALVAQSPAIYEKLGIATRYSTITSESAAAVSAGASAILYHISSPGGTVSGNVEAAEFIASIRIPTASHCVGLACSAAYKLAAGTGAIIASPSAEIGNIGTILSWMDCSEMWREMGVEFKAITNEGADLKSTFHLEPNATQLAFLQERINDAGSEFRSHVEAGRSAAGAELNEEVWRAGWYSGKRAGEMGLIDGIGTESDAREWLIGRM
jgi:protease-4